MTTKEKTKEATARREAADETTSSERLTALAEESATLARIVAKNPSAPVGISARSEPQRRRRDTQVCGSQPTCSI